MKANVEFSGLTVPEMYSKLALLAELMGVSDVECGMEVQGTFVDEDGNLAFLGSSFSRVDASIPTTDPSDGRRTWLRVWVDEDWAMLQPEDNEPVPVVRMCYPKPDSIDDIW